MTVTPDGLMPAAAATPVTGTATLDKDGKIDVKGASGVIQGGSGTVTINADGTVTDVTNGE